MINKIMNSLLEKRLKEMQERCQEPNIFRASSSGLCTRKLAYQYHGFKPDLLQNYEQAENKEQFIQENNILARVELVFERRS
jgi:hypothetical protein